MSDSRPTSALTSQETMAWPGLGACQTWRTSNEMSDPPKAVPQTSIRIPQAQYTTSSACQGHDPSSLVDLTGRPDIDMGQVNVRLPFQPLEDQPKRPSHEEGLNATMFGPITGSMGYSKDTSGVNTASYGTCIEPWRIMPSSESLRFSSEGGQVGRTNEGTQAWPGSDPQSPHNNMALKDLSLAGERQHNWYVILCRGPWFVSSNSVPIF
jgi:hypothetical protein